MRDIHKKNPIGNSMFKPEQSGRAEYQMLQSDEQNFQPYFPKAASEVKEQITSQNTKTPLITWAA